MTKRRKLPGLSYANVVATLALFVALGGSAYAVKQLPKNSVGKRQIKKNAVTMPKIRRNAVNGRRVKNNSLTGADIKLSKLGTVLSARTAASAATANTATTAGTAGTAGTANVANSLPPSEAWHEVGAPGEPGFQNSWVNEPAVSAETAAFYKDREGVVHLKGFVRDGALEVIFQLPPGYRPASGKRIRIATWCGGGTCDITDGSATIEGPDTGLPAGAVKAPPGAIRISLDGISFRAES